MRIGQKQVDSFKSSPSASGRCRKIQNGIEINKRLRAWSLANESWPHRVVQLREVLHDMNSSNLDRAAPDRGQLTVQRLLIGCFLSLGGEIRLQGLRQTRPRRVSYHGAQD